MKNSKFSLKRFVYAALTLVVYLLFVTVACIINSVLADKMVCIICVTVVFMLIFFTHLTRKRIDGELPEKSYVSYEKMLLVSIMSWCAFIIFLFIPTYFAPFILISIILSGVYDISSMTMMSIYFTCVFALIKNTSVNYLVGIILLSLIGAMLSVYLKNKSGIEKIFSIIIVLSVQILVPVVVYYIDNLEVEKNAIIYAFISGIIAAVLASFVPLVFDISIKKANETVLEELTVENHPLVEDIRRFSFYEYNHARRVMRLSRVAAASIGADMQIAGLGGMYYRLGKILGEPEIDNAVKAANNHCFPQQAIDILYEYNGILRKPTSKESAIVQMVDAVVTKIELLDKDSMSSSWNQNMVIYQTINELSESGIYDESGMSMNAFLKVREVLAKEDILA